MVLLDHDYGLDRAELPVTQKSQLEHNALYETANNRLKPDVIMENNSYDVSHSSTDAGSREKGKNNRTVGKTETNNHPTPCDIAGVVPETSVHVTNANEQVFVTSAASLTPAEWTRLLKTWKVTVKTVASTKHKPISASKCKQNYFTSARWRCANAPARAKSSRLKWHHTNFDGNKSKRPKTPVVKPQLPYATPLAQAWLDLAVRDVAAAETIQTTQVERVWSDRTSTDKDPCLISVASADDTIPELLHTVTSCKMPTCDNCKIETAAETHEQTDRLFLALRNSTVGGNGDKVLPHNQRKPCDDNLRQVERSHVDQLKKCTPKAEDILCDANNADYQPCNVNYQSPKCMVQNFMTYPTHQHVASNNTNILQDDWVSEKLFEDLFGNSSNLLNESAVNEAIMDNNFLESFLSSNCDETMQIVSPPVRSLQPTICHNEDQICNSDTDSGIHSPGALKSSTDDVCSWKDEVESPDLEMFFNYTNTTTCTEASSPDNRMMSQPKETESFLLNMDKQDQFYKVEPCFSADEMLVKTPQCTNLSTDVTNAEYRSPAETSWQLSLAANNQSSTFQTFVADSAIPKDNSQQKSKTKSSKRKLQCAKMRRISDKAGKHIHLWEFIRDILLEPRHCPSLIKWEDRKSGVFRFVQSDTVASMWGEQKGNPKMTYEKLSRAMRYYYNRGILERVDGRRLVYKFGPSAHGWRTTEKSNKDCTSGSTATAGGVNNSEGSNVKSPSIQSPVQMQTTFPVKIEPGLKFSAQSTQDSSLPSANVLLGRNIKLAS
ncbi:uncharacterized protein LOC143445608 [Clavelina lepadiformis]|uniref:uncharacterized protein LOC143445608 n=1 Tax=Clavelina lepadiformis TaxID=159417 RepID=UPI004043044F